MKWKSFSQLTNKYALVNAIIQTMEPVNIKQKKITQNNWNPTRMSVQSERIVEIPVVKSGILGILEKTSFDNKLTKAIFYPNFSIESTRGLDLEILKVYMSKEVNRVYADLTYIDLYKLQVAVKEL